MSFSAAGGHSGQMSAISLLLFPDMGYLMERGSSVLNDNVNSRVEKFLDDFHRTGYCIINLPSHAFGAAFERRNHHLIRVKLLYLISHLFFRCGHHVFYTKWHQFTVSDGHKGERRFVGSFKFKTFCVECAQDRSKFWPNAARWGDREDGPGIFSGKVFVDLRFLEDSGSVWLNLQSELPKANLCSDCKSKQEQNLHPQATATMEDQARNSLSIVLLFCYADLFQGILQAESAEDDNEDARTEGTEIIYDSVDDDDMSFTDATLRYHYSDDESIAFTNSRENSNPGSPLDDEEF